MVCMWKKVFPFTSGSWLLYLFFFTCVASATWAQCPTSATIPPTACIGDNCGTGIQIGPIVGGSTNDADYAWVFIAPDGSQDTVKQRQPVYNFTQQGQYQVRLLVNGVSCTSGTVNVGGFSEFVLTPDDNLGTQEEEICKGTTITLQAEFAQGSAPAGSTYLWSTGETTETITVSEEKCYSLTITDPATGCTRSNKVNLTLYKPDPNNPPPPKEQSRWYFGQGAGIVFEGGQPRADTSRVRVPEGTSTISDVQGNFLFYTDGKNVYDKDGNPMKDLNGLDVIGAINGLKGGAATTQGVLIVRQPGCNTCDPVYYIFTTTDITATGAQLYYSIVDMRQNGGKGQVMQKNVPLFNTSTERVVSITAEPDTANPDRPETNWVITHDFNTNTFRVYPLTPQGLGQPKTYSVGAPHGPDPSAGEGYMKVYNDKLVVVIPGETGKPNVVQVFTFNSATGAVTGPPKTITLRNSPPKAYGVEIVGDSTLYVSMSGVAPDSSFIYGYNLNATKIDTTRRLIFGTPEFTIGALQLDPDGNRLFVAQNGETFLGEIVNSTSLLAATYNDQAIDLKSKQSQLGLPNTGPPDNKGYGQGFGFETPICTLADTKVTLKFQAQPDRADGDPEKSSYAWKFTGTSTTGTPLSIDVPDQGFGINAEISVEFPGPGTYLAALTITNDCQSEVIPAQAVLIPLQPPPLNVVSKSGCKNANGSNPSLTLDAYEGISGLPASFIYQWTNTATNTVVQTGPSKTFTTSVAGSYQVRVINGSCTATAVGSISFSSVTVNLGPDRSSCRTETITLDAGNPGMNYQWVDGVGAVVGSTQVITVTPAVTTTYKVTVTDPTTGCTATDDVKVNVGQEPVLNPVITPVSGCGIKDGKINLGIPISDQNNYNYIWYFPDSSMPQPLPVQEISALGVGIYRIIVKQKAAPNCEKDITLSIGDGATTAVQFNALVPTINCDATTADKITLTRSDNSPSRPTFTYSWLDENGIIPGQFVTLASDYPTIVLQPAGGLKPGFYTITGSYGGTCSFSFTYEIKQPTTKPTVKASFAKTGCGQAELLASGVFSGTPVWTSSNGTPITAISGKFFVSTAGTYTVTVGTAPCTTTDKVTVTVDNAPTRYQYGKVPDPVCVGQTVTLKAPLSSDWDSYVWVFPDKTIFVGADVTTPSLTTGGVYTIRVRNTTTGCQDSAQVNVTVIPTPEAPKVTAPAPICAGSPRPTLKASGENLIWYSDAALTTSIATGSSFTPPINTNLVASYTYYVTQATSSTTGSCPGPPAIVTVTVIPKPEVSLGPDVTVCEGTPVSLSPETIVPNAAYAWSSGQKTPTLNVTRNGTYILTVTSGGCSSTDMVVVKFLSAPRIALPRREVPVCRDNAELTARLDAGPGSGFTYQWRKLGESTILGTERVYVAQNVDIGAVFVVTVENGSICISTDTIRVVDKCEPQLNVPQAFTPNDDGSNDKLEVFRAYVGEFKMLVYNRWGEVIFATESFENFWDGTYKGVKVPPGTYIWKVVYTAKDYPERPPVELRGGVLVLR